MPPTSEVMAEVSLALSPSTILFFRAWGREPGDIMYDLVIATDSASEHRWNVILLCELSVTSSGSMSCDL
jgi:hypothetical protein